MSAQQQVVDATRARGYWEGYSAYQMLARNLVKMGEELAESTRCVCVDAETDTAVESPTDALFTLVGLLCKARFDERDPSRWPDVGGLHKSVTAIIAKELADMQIVLFNAAQALAEVRGEPFDLVAAAIDKSRADVSRGVRGAE